MWSLHPVGVGVSLDCVCVWRGPDGDPGGGRCVSVWVVSGPCVCVSGGCLCVRGVSGPCVCVWRGPDGDPGAGEGAPHAGLATAGSAHGPASEPAGHSASRGLGLSISAVGAAAAPVLRAC